MGGSILYVYAVAMRRRVWVGIARSKQEDIALRGHER